MDCTLIKWKANETSGHRYPRKRVFQGAVIRTVTLPGHSSEIRCSGQGMLTETG